MTGPAADDTALSALAAANSASNEEFVRDYLRPSDSDSDSDSGSGSGSGSWPAWTHPTTGEQHALGLARAADLSAADRAACLALVHATSGDDYRASPGGWRPAAKRREMAAPALRYLLVRDAAARIAAFASLMPTWEAREPVVYCYEIHLEPGLRGTGLGRLLMGLVVRAADHMPPVAKVMLTCFVRNARARAFYRKLGFVVDASSPPERTLRAGRVVTPDYEILSRPTRAARTDG